MLIKKKIFALLLGSIILKACQGEHAEGGLNNDEEENKMNKENVVIHPYVGMWVTDNGHVRLELLPNGRYDEARGNRQSAYQGRYAIKEDYIEFWDDTGFTADGNFEDDVLYHAGMVLYREEKRF